MKEEGVRAPLFTSLGQVGAQVRDPRELLIGNQIRC